MHGALDPSLFVGPDASIHLLFAAGGSNVNLWTMPLNANADPIGSVMALASRAQPWEDWFLENPAMYFDGTTYLLAYSAGHWDAGTYVTGIDRCASPSGPCTARTDGPWLQSIGDRAGPGGLEFFTGADGGARVAYQSFPSNNINPIGARGLHIRRFSADPWPRLG